MSPTDSSSNPPVGETKDAGPLTRVDDGPLTILTLDSPPLNLFNRRMFDAWVGVVEELVADPPRGLLIRAQGRVVSGGVDVHVFEGLKPSQAAALFRELLSVTRGLESLPCPTVFAAHALTLTAAFEIALACDLIVAARSATFGLVEAVVGMTPAMGGTQRIAERAGPMRAREVVMTADLYDARTLSQWNLVSRVFDDADFDERSRAFAASLAGGPTRAHAVTKRIVRSFVNSGTDVADATVPEAVGALYETEDLHSAVQSFLRDGPGKATFTGK
jgi:enoyl-CoA hydratase